MFTLGIATALFNKRDNYALLYMVPVVLTLDVG